jgi:hypothetical protein
VDRFGAGGLGRSEDLVSDEIGLRRRRRADGHRLVRHIDEQRIRIGLGIDRNRRYAHAPRRLDDAAGDLAAIGDEEFREHGRFAREAGVVPHNRPQSGRAQAWRLRDRRPQTNRPSRMGGAT